MKTYKEFISEAGRPLSTDINEASFVSVDTIRFERSNNGKKPKPTESGQWWFTNVRMGDKGDTFTSSMVPYKEAVKQAKKWAKDNGYSVIYVME